MIQSNISIVEALTQLNVAVEHLAQSVQRSHLMNELTRGMLKARSQFGQDLFALRTSNFKTGGFFVEFGACDGVTLSNTYLLEKSFGWKGILAEPGIRWGDSISKNRDAKIEKRCVWNNSGEAITFYEGESPEVSGTETSSFNSYTVQTISLYDMLVTHGAPREVDFLSIDTEGSELRILKSFDFSEFSFEVDQFFETGSWER